MINRRRFFKKISALAFLPVAGPFIKRTRTEDLFLFECFVAGFAYYDGEKEMETLAPGDPLLLKREPHNPYDPRAIEVYTRQGTKLGYVPKRINTVPMAILDQSVELKAVIKEINLPPAPTWERVRLEVRQPMAVNI